MKLIFEILSTTFSTQKLNIQIVAAAQRSRTSSLSKNFSTTPSSSCAARNSRYQELIAISTWAILRFHPTKVTPEGHCYIYQWSEQAKSWPHSSQCSRKNLWGRKRSVQRRQKSFWLLQTIGRYERCRRSVSCGKVPIKGHVKLKAIIRWGIC